MDLKKKASLIIYRFREQGLEIFLVNSNEENGETWGIPERPVVNEKPTTLIQDDRLIELDPVEEDNGNTEEAWAVEGDWHEIPSLKAMLYEDAMQLKEKVKDIEKGAYYTVKEAVKKVLPHQYNFLKELKDILIDRNSLKDL
ncbi:MAG: hypothetical protein DHS20C18_08530 [Saprospiraceae bacterium]|nr:MAG: hypothetical protein DHS20C18_08530 [Saprospiraceae bacterium]